MAKTKTAFVCQNCGTNVAKWVGKCPTCSQWNTFVEEIVEKTSSTNFVKGLSKSSSKPQKLAEIQQSEEVRIDTGNQELNRILGGGLVLGSLVLIGGEPGIGKSTLMLQVALGLKNKTLYVSGEESLSQIKLRAERLKLTNDQTLFLSETSTEKILLHLEQSKADLAIIDSIQTIYTDRVESSPGSVTQVRESTVLLLKYAKENNVPIILIGHINKDGNLAGPKTLEHIVDTVLQFEGDKNYLYRILRSQKNRFGSRITGFSE